jgi:hypothetical protein
MNQEVLRISREFKCCAGCCWCAGCCDCCSYEIVVETGNGEILGFVRQRGSFWKAQYDILDANENVEVKIKGPCCVCDGPCCPCDNEFKIVGSDGETQIGSIVKEYNGFVKEMFTTADRFSITCI